MTSFQYAVYDPIRVVSGYTAWNSLTFSAIWAGYDSSYGRVAGTGQLYGWGYHLGRVRSFPQHQLTL